MAYNDFAYWYDDLNQEADFDNLVQELHAQLLAAGIPSGIVADLGCGTGEVCLRLARLGYEMIGIDLSPDMLSVLRDKMTEDDSVLLLCQDLSELDLYGTIAAAVSTYDTFNHLPKEQLLAALGKIHLFMEPGGLLLFDANTPFKHREVLADNCFELTDEEGFVCEWRNEYNPTEESTTIHLIAAQDGEPVFEEWFTEYSYSREFWETALKQSGFEIVGCKDGETFGEVQRSSQRFLFAARKPQ